MQGCATANKTISCQHEAVVINSSISDCVLGTSGSVCVGCSGKQAHATIPKQPNVGGHGVASEELRTMYNPATHEALSTDWEATMQDG